MLIVVWIAFQALEVLAYSLRGPVNDVKAIFDLLRLNDFDRLRRCRRRNRRVIYSKSDSGYDSGLVIRA
jgi:hypothetical protein